MFTHVAVRDNLDTRSSESNPALEAPKTILVADDHEATLLGLAELLSAEGFNVVTAEDGQVALAEFLRAKPDLVLSDVKMPGLSGIELCRHIKNNPETRLVPLVLITALTAVQDRVAGIQAGADDFLTKPVDRLQLIARVQSLLRQKAYTDDLERAESVLFALAMSIEGKDPYTEGHCVRLAEQSARLGEFLGLEAPQIIALRRAGLVHDIGKVAVPDSILLKPTRLTAAERKIMQNHTIVGERICSPLKSFHLVLPVIRHHHEKMNGTGYPDKLKGEEIPLTARILQIVDVYDALTTSRPYKPALPSEEALAVMRKEVRKGWWDPHVFAEFECLIEKDVQKFVSLVKTAAAGGH